MICTKEEFAEWKGHPVTKALFEHMRSLISDSKDTLGSNAGQNPLADRDLVGGISALTDVLEWQPDIIDEEHEIH